MFLFILQHLKGKKLFGEDRAVLQFAENVCSLRNGSASFTDKGEKFHRVYIVASGAVFGGIKQDRTLPQNSALSAAAHLHP